VLCPVACIVHAYRLFFPSPCCLLPFSAVALVYCMLLAFRTFHPLHFQALLSETSPCRLRSLTATQSVACGLSAQSFACRGEEHQSATSCVRLGSTTACRWERRVAPARAPVSGVD
jgi:hypothetical protein